MNNDQQFWTAFKEVAQAAPPQLPREDQWEALLQNLPAPKRRFPLRGWLGINLLGLLLIWSLGNLSASFKSETLAYSDQARNKQAEQSKVFRQATEPSRSYQLSVSDSPILSGDQLNAQVTTTALQTIDQQFEYRDSGRSKIFHQATDPSRPYQLPLFDSSDSFPAEQTLPHNHPATDYSRQSIHSSTTPLPTRLYSLANPSTIQLPSNYTIATLQARPLRLNQLSLLLHPFQNLDGNQGIQPEIQLSSSLPFLGLKAGFRLSQVVSSRTWATLSAEQLEDYQTQAPGLLTDAAQQEQALVIGLEINRPLLKGKGRLQISPGIGTSFRLIGRRDHRLQSITEYSTGQTATLTNYSNREGLNYWGTYLGLQFHYQLKGRLGLTLQSRHWLSSQQIAPGQATSLGLGLTYQFE